MVLSKEKNVEATFFKVFECKRKSTFWEDWLKVRSDNAQHLERVMRNQNLPWLRAYCFSWSDQSSAWEVDLREVTCFSFPLKAASSTKREKGCLRQSCRHWRKGLLSLLSGLLCDGIWASFGDSLSPIQKYLCLLFRAGRWSRSGCRQVVHPHRLKECQLQCFRLKVCGGSDLEYWIQ